MLQQDIDRIVSAALAEDIGGGDITTEACVLPQAMGKGRLIAKEAGIICGFPVAARVFAILGPEIEFFPIAEEGGQVEKDTVIATIAGPAAMILSGERVALNLLQRMSGIATQTARAVAAVSGTKAKITDTRKTTPLLRVLEKYAVRIGGGTNHRTGLYDGVLIKDNHIAAAGGIGPAVTVARKRIPHTLKIEVETTNPAEIDAALAARADIIMLDNMSIAAMEAAVRQIAGRAVTEASGNMGDKDLAAVAATGVDFISIGALTHSVRALDISLKLEK